MSYPLRDTERMVNIRTHKRLTSATILPDGDDLRIDGPEGPIRLQRANGQITATYEGRTLKNGSAAQYAAILQQQMIQKAKAFQPAWTTDRSGRQRITDPQKFYAETFDRNAVALERLKSWMD